MGKEERCFLPNLKKLGSPHLNFDEMCLPEESGYDVYDCEYSYHKPKQKQKYKKRLNQYEKKRIDKVKLNKLSNTVWWAVQDNGEYKNRNYLSNKRKVAKKQPIKR